MIDFLIYLAYFILSLNLILYSYSLFRNKKANVFFVCYLAFTFLMQFSMELLYLIKVSNLFAVNIFFIGQMVLLGLFYNSLFSLIGQKLFVKISLAVALLFLAVQFMIDSNQFLRFNLFEITLTSLMIVVYALLHFYNMLTESKKFYYVNFSLVFYFLASTFIFLIGNLSLGLSNDIKYLTWELNAFLLVVYEFIILYEWIISFYKKK